VQLCWTLLAGTRCQTTFLLLAQHAAQASELPMPSGCCSTMACCLCYTAGAVRGVQMHLHDWFTAQKAHCTAAQR
jgi:hypothetical protein